MSDELELDYEPDPRGVVNCSRCGALTRTPFHSCEAFLERRALRLDDELDEVERRRRRGIWWMSEGTDARRK